MNCPNCSTPIFPGAAFCLECGAKLPAARARVCTACGMELADGVHFCAGCGAPVAEEAVQAEVAVEEPVVIEPVAEETVEATEEIVAEEPVAEPEIHEQEEEIIAEEIPAEGAVVVEEAAAWQPPAQPPQKGGFGRAFLSVLLCILIFILSVPTMLIGEIRMLTSEDGLKSVVDAISIDKIKIGSAEQDGEMVSATEALLDLVKKYDDDIIITEKEFNTFIEKSTIKSFVAKKIAAVADDIYTGKDSSEITKKEVIQLLKDNEKELRKLDLYLDDEMCEQIAEGLESEGILEAFSAEFIREENQDVALVIRYFFSYLILALLIILIVLLGVMIIRTNSYKKARSLTYIGTTLFLAGFILSFPGIIAYIIPDLFIIPFGGMKTIGIFVVEILKVGFVVPAAVFGVGILMLIVRRIITVVCRKKAAKAC